MLKLLKFYLDKNTHLSNSASNNQKISRLIQEEKILKVMIGIYCRHFHNGNNGLCPDCSSLQEYACKRLTQCPYGQEKYFCSGCKTHCYKPEMREKIRDVMRFSGPRMIKYHPVWALRHLLQKFTNNPKGTKYK